MLGETASARAPDSLPELAPRQVPRPRRRPLALNPSRAGGVGGGDRERALEGRLAHALLEMLPNLPPERRPGAAVAYLDAWGGALAESARAALASKVLAAIGAPELSPIFSPGSRGEVPLTGLLPRPGRPDLPYSGRLDRLVATDEGVLIVDFKLGEKPDRPAAAHVAQLALYRAALQPLYRGRRFARRSSIWTARRSRRSSGEELDAALNAVVEAS